MEKSVTNDRRMVFKKQPVKFLLSCEHAGNQVPRSFARLFKNRQWLLETHRGYDPGAFFIAQRLAKQLKVKLYSCRTTRLLVDVNRTLSQETLFSSLSQTLSVEEKERALNRYYWPYWDELETNSCSGRVFHFSIHTFTPVMKGVRRKCDIGLLYKRTDRRARAIAQRMKIFLDKHHPEILVRENFPYDAESGGIMQGLRSRHKNRDYSGLYIEINQKISRNPRRAERVAAALSQALLELKHYL